MGLVKSEFLRMFEHWEKQFKRNRKLSLLLLSFVVFVFAFGYIEGGLLHGVWEASGGLLFFLLLVTSAMDTFKVINLLFFILFSGFLLLLSFFTTHMSVLCFAVFGASIIVLITDGFLK